MKIITNIALTVLLVLGVTGCAKTPMGETAHKGDFAVSKLFVQDGCTVYRFYDAGQLVYFTKCEGVTNSSASSIQSCGKNCERAELNPTEYH